MRLNHVQIFRAKFIPGVSLSLEESVETWVKLSLALKIVVEVCQNFFFFFLFFRVFLFGQWCCPFFVGLRQGSVCEKLTSPPFGSFSASLNFLGAVSAPKTPTPERLE